MILLLHEGCNMDFFFTAVPRGNEVEVFILLYRAVLLYLQNTATFYRKNL
jgi:hypothetical protein